MKNKLGKILTMLFCIVCLVAMLALPCFADTTDSITIDVSRLPNRSFDYSTPVLTLPQYTNYTILVDGVQVFTGVIESVSTLDSIDSVTYELNAEIGVTYTVQFGSEEINSYEPFLTYNGDSVDTVTFVANGIEYDPDYPFVLGDNDPTGVTHVFSAMIGFIMGSLNTIQGIFYNGSLTLIGSLATIGVSIAVLLLIFYCVRRFLELR